MLPSQVRDESHLREKCGVFGVYAPGEEVARITFFGIHALQHRGQESAGIATSNFRTLYLKTGMGLVSQVFDEDDLSYLPGAMAIGHTRYSTTGASRLDNAQPLRVSGPNGEIALGHNGNIVNAAVLRDELVRDGIACGTGSDSEVIALMLANAPGSDWRERWGHVMRKLNGAYSLAVLTPDALMMARDPMGNRPLALGRIDNGWVAASESCAFDHLGATFIREIEPGEVVYIDAEGLQSFRPVDDMEQREAFCVFEYVYFSRPDSVLDGKLVYPVRMNLGRELAKEHPADADVVIGVPDSATPAALGYSHASGIPFVEGLVKNRYVGRTFIKPDQRLREVGVHLKFNPLREVLQDRRVVLVDDSVVRGTTSKKIVQLMYEAGAREVHMRIASPPITHPDYYGIDTPDKGDLLAANKDLEGMRQFLGADSLAFLSVDGIYRAVGLDARDARAPQFTDHCFTGEYPTPLTDQTTHEPAPRQLSLLAEAS